MILWVSLVSKYEILLLLLWMVSENVSNLPIWKVKQYQFWPEIIKLQFRVMPIIAENNSVSDGEFTQYLEGMALVLRKSTAKEEPRVTNTHVAQWTMTQTGSSWIDWRTESDSLSLDDAGFDISSGIIRNFMTNSFS